MNQYHILEELEFIHITKTGGTSIELWGEARGIKWAYKNKSYLNKFSRYNYKNCSSWHVPPKYFHNNPYEKKRTFTVVRNPYTRLISEFYCPWSGHKTKHYLQSNHSKEGLNYWIQNLMRTADTVSGMPQSTYLPVDHILKFENLQNDFTNLMLSYGISEKDTILGRSNVGRNKIFTMNDLTKETIQQINYKYDEDFKVFQYQKIKP